MVLKIQTEEIQIQPPKETSMETLKIREEPRPSYKRTHYSLILFVFIQVAWYFTFSEPLTALWGGTPLFPGAVSDNILTRSGRLIMIYHSLAMPFLVANTFWIMEYYEIRKKWIPTLKILLEPGAYIVGIAGMVFAYTGLHLFHTIFYFGLFLVFLGGIVFVIAAWPIPNKFPNPETAQEGSMFHGFSLENYALVVLAICVIISAVYGAFAAIENFTGTIWGFGREPQAFLAEAIIRKHSHDLVEDLIVSHLHIQLAQCAAMVVMVGYKTTHVKPKTYKKILIASPIGVLVISWGAWILKHPIIWVGAGILILCTTAMAIEGLKEASMKYLGERYETASKWEKFKGIFPDPIKFTYYFVFLYAQIVVTIAGIYVGLNTIETYRRYEYTFLEYGFNVGHWHLLSVLLAILLMIQSIDYIKVSGTPRKWFGWIMFIGSNMTFTGGNLYMLRAYNTPPEIFLWITYIGVYFLFVGFVMGIILLVKRYSQSQKEAKLGIIEALM